jgi:transcriptional regulator with XRE-family HTH domain
MARAGAGKMSQGELASRVGALLNTPISRSIISRVESADRDAEGRLLAAISTATETDYDWLNEPNREAATVNSAKGASLSSWLDTSTYLIPDWHPANLFVKDEWHQRDEVDLRVVDLQVEKLPIAV